MTDALYLKDAYLTAFDGRVLAAREGLVELDRTAFYPTGGGQPDDCGVLKGPEGRTWRVEGVEKQEDRILHRVVDSFLPGEGTTVSGVIDWDRRYGHMRYHTALHILSGVVFHKFGSRITGGRIAEDEARMDFALPEFHRALAEELIQEANDVVVQNLPVEVRFVSRAEAESTPEIVRVAAELMPASEIFRLIDIVGFDVQADGGTHVRSTAEVGRLTLDRIENKGARNKRLYLHLGSDPG